jgi:ubiquinone/menaquinone biosynthesis C-methylase UbiE
MSARLDERYAAGYEASMQQYLKLHTVERCAGFFTPLLRSGMSLLDAGCGPGTITVGLARVIAPGRLVALDASEDEVHKTRRALELAGCVSTQVDVGDIRSLPFEDGSFDAVFSHAVLDYLPDPSRAIEEFGRVLKPGGVIGLRSVSGGDLISPSNELIEESLLLFHRAAAAQGGDFTRGRLLGQLLKDGGFERIFARPSYERAESPEEWEGFCRVVGDAYTSGRVVELALSKGWLDESRLAEITEAWDRLVSDPSNCLGFSWIEAVAFKPV